MSRRLLAGVLFSTLMLVVTGLLSGCMFIPPSAYYTSKILPDTAVTIVSEKYIPYGSDDYEIEELLLPDGDLVIVRSLEDDTVVIERFDKDTLRVEWGEKIYLDDHESWTPTLHFGKEDNTLSLIAHKVWDGGDSVGLQAIELDPVSGRIKQDRWLSRYYHDRDSFETRTPRRTVFSEDKSKIAFYYIDLRSVVNGDDDKPHDIHIHFEVYDLKFNHLGKGTITRTLPAELDDKEDVARAVRGIRVDNKGDIFCLNFAVPNIIQVTRHLIQSGTQTTLESSWDGVDVLDEEKGFGALDFESDHVDNLWVAAPWLQDEREVGGICLAKYNFNTRQVPITTRFNFTSSQVFKLIDDNELENYYVTGLTLHDGVVLVQLGNDNSGWVTSKHAKWYQWEQNDLILMGFDLQGNPLYQTPFRKEQKSYQAIGGGVHDVGYSFLSYHDRISFYYTDRDLEGIVTRMLDTKTGKLSDPQAVFELGWNSCFVKHASAYDFRDDSWFFVFHKGMGASNAHIYKVKLNQSKMRYLPLD